MPRFILTSEAKAFLAENPHAYEIRGQQYTSPQNKVNLAKYTLENGAIVYEDVQYTVITGKYISFFIRLSVYYNDRLVADFGHPALSE